jgi:hypothetical protein
VDPAARQGGTADDPSGGVRLAQGLDAATGRTRLARGLNAPSGEVRLARGLNAPSGEVRLALGLNAPSGEVRLARGLNTPSAGTASLEGTCTHVVHAPAPVYGHLMLWHRRTRATTLPGPAIASRRCFTNSLGKAILATVWHCAMRPVSAPRHCAAYPRTANASSP